MKVEKAERAVNRGFYAARKILFAVATFFSLQGCGGSSGGDEIVINKPAPPLVQCRTYVVAKDDATAADSNDGRYIQDGGNGPWRTIQHAVDSVEPCDTIQVRASATPYTEIATGQFPGIVIGRGGEINKPITIEGYPGERPVLDQQQDGNSTSSVSGIVLNCVSWITLRNIEIRNIADAGISSSLSGCATSNIIIDNLHIHRVFGGNLAAGIRLAGVSAARISNNTLSDIYKTRDDTGPTVSPGYADASNIAIENNTILLTDIGVSFSLLSANQLVQSTVSHNIFHDIKTALNFLSMTTGGAFSQANFYGNLVYDIDRAVSAELINANNPSKDLVIHNNTFTGAADTAINIQNTIGISIYNNIFTHINAEYLDAGNGVAFDYMDNNIYWSDHANGWVLATAGMSRAYTTLEEWRTAYSSEMPPGLSANPDDKSRLVDPLFIDAASHDFRLDDGSPALKNGRAGTTIGAYFDTQSVGAFGR